MTTPSSPVPPPYQQPSPGPGYAGQPGYPGYPVQAGGPAQPPDAGAKPPRQPVQVWDVVLTIVFLVGLVAYTAVASLMGLFLIMGSDSCSVRDCSTELITIGWLIGTLLPWVVLIAAAVVSIVFMVKRRIAFYIPLLGAVGVTGALVIGFLVVAAGVPQR